MRLLRAFLVLSLLLLPQMANAETLMMATTTSTQDTGLLEYLQPIFKKDTGIDLKWISVGTGKALAHGKDCDVDVLLVHAPALEEKFVADGFGVDRHQVMYNDFVLIGPAADPAGVKGKDIPTALNLRRKEDPLREPRRQLRHAQHRKAAVESRRHGSARQGRHVVH